jgi:hypothetical protein
LDGAGLGGEHRGVARLDRHDGCAEIEVAQLAAHDGEHGQGVGAKYLRRPHPGETPRAQLRGEFDCLVE